MLFLHAVWNILSHPHSDLYMEGSFSLLRTLLKYYLFKEAFLTFPSEAARVILQSLPIRHPLKSFSQHLSLSEIIKRIWIK